MYHKMPLLYAHLMEGFKPNQPHINLDAIWNCEGILQQQLTVCVIIIGCTTSLVLLFELYS